jgi:hypothetical protein
MPQNDGQETLFVFGHSSWKPNTTAFLALATPSAKYSEVSL